MGAQQTKALKEKYAPLIASDDPVIGDRKLEDIFFRDVLTDKAPPEAIRRTAIRIDEDGDVSLVCDTALKQFGFVVLLDGALKAKKGLSWTQMRALADVVRMTVRGTLVTSEAFDAAVARLRSKYVAVQTKEMGSRTVVMIQPPDKPCKYEPTSIKPGIFAEAEGDLLLGAQTLPAEDDLSVLKFLFHLRLLVAPADEQRWIPLSMKEGEALADLLTVCEPGDKLDPVRLLAVVAMMRIKYNFVSLERKEEADLFIIKITPTRVENPEPVPEILQAALDAERARNKMSQQQQQRNAGGDNLYPGVVIESKIAESGQGVVFRGQYKDKDVAIKIFRGKGDLTDYKSEIRGLLKTGGHENVMEVMDFFEHPQPCIVTRFVSGGSLSSWLKKKALSKAILSETCTFAFTREEFAEQWFFTCKTCSASENIGCCQTCSEICHKGKQIKLGMIKNNSENVFGHEIEQVGLVPAFCDCGHEGIGATKCKCMKPWSDDSAIDTDTALQIATKIARGLQHLHSNGFVHRDFKSANVLIDEGDNPIIIDMGLGTKFDSKSASQADEHLGTLLWMAPEMITNKIYSDKTDVYAFGIVLWEIFSCRLPYAREESAEEFDLQKFLLSVSVLGKRPDVAACGSRPRWALDLMKACWSSDPQDRPSMASVLETLENGGEMVTQDARLVFRRTDKDNSGELDVVEFSTLMQNLKVKCTGKELLDLFQTIDLNGNGLIDEEEFMSWWNIVRTRGLESAIKFRTKAMNLKDAPQKDVVNVVNKGIDGPSTSDLVDVAAERLVETDQEGKKSGPIDIHEGIFRDHFILVNDEFNAGLLEAAYKNDLNGARVALEAGADPNSADSEEKGGATALYYAALNNNFDLVALLLRYGANVNGLGLDGDTPLHGAASGGFEDMCVLLLSSYADVLAENREGKVPSECANEAGWPACGSVLRAKELEPSSFLVWDSTIQTRSYATEEGQDPVSVLKRRIDRLTDAPLEAAIMLSVQNCDLSDLPDELSKFVNLEMLSLQLNRFTALPAVLKKLPKLETLILNYNNPLTDFSGLAALENLGSLHLRAVGLTSFPEAIVQLPQLEELYLDNNELSSLPSTLSKLNLIELNISHNRFRSVPDVIFSIPTLTKLNISGNQIAFLPVARLVDALPQLDSLNTENNDALAEDLQFDLEENELREKLASLSGAAGGGARGGAGAGAGAGGAGGAVGVNAGELGERLHNVEEQLRLLNERLSGLGALSESVSRLSFNLETLIAIQLTKMKK